MSKFLLIAMFAVGLALCGTEVVSAQEGPGGAINPNRDCQTLLTCNFRKGGSWRGCVLVLFMPQVPIRPGPMLYRRRQETASMSAAPM